MKRTPTPLHTYCSFRFVFIIHQMETGNNFWKFNTIVDDFKLKCVIFVSCTHKILLLSLIMCHRQSKSSTNIREIKCWVGTSFIISEHVVCVHMDPFKLFDYLNDKSREYSISTERKQSKSTQCLIDQIHWKIRDSVQSLLKYFDKKHGLLGSS